MRLIDANKLLMLIKEQKEKETGSYTKGINNGLNIVKSIINDKEQMPTAYDIDKVVEQLEDCISDTTDSLTGIGAKWAYKGAIEIVKRGGRNDNAED